MEKKKQPGEQSPSCSYTLLLLRAHNIQLLVDKLGIISNELQALGSIFESLGSSITVHGNIIGKIGFELETTSTKLHINSVIQELNDQKEDSKSSLLLQLRAYYLLLTANRLGVISNELQAFGAYLQAIGAALVAYGNYIAIKAFELETIATKLQIESVLQEIEEQKSQEKTYESHKNDYPSIISHIESSQQIQLKELFIQIKQLQNIVNAQQSQISEIKKKTDKL
jgi:hypothetical protein